MNPFRFLDKPENRDRVIRYFFISLGILLIAELFIHKHAELPWEAAPGFYAVSGFTACVSLIFIAKLLRFIVKRDEDYYDK